MTMRSSIGVHRLPNDVSWVESSANGDTQRWTHWLPQRLSVIDRRACCLSKVRNPPLLRDETSACCPPTAGKPRPRRPLPSRAAVHISSPPTDQMAPADAPRAVAAAAAFSSPAHCPDACHSTVYHTPTSWCEGVTRAPPMAVTAAAALGARATSLAQSSRALPLQPCRRQCRRRRQRSRRWAGRRTGGRAMGCTIARPRSQPPRTRGCSSRGSGGSTADRGRGTGREGMGVSVRPKSLALMPEATTPMLRHRHISHTEEINARVT